MYGLCFTCKKHVGVGDVPIVKSPEKSSNRELKAVDVGGMRNYVKIELYSSLFSLPLFTCLIMSFICLIICISE